MTFYNIEKYEKKLFKEIKGFSLQHIGIEAS